MKNQPSQGDSTSRLPSASRVGDGQRTVEALGDLSADQRALVMASAGNSPFLGRLLVKYPHVLQDFTAQGAAALINDILAMAAPIGGQPALMKALRVQKSQAALAIALADISSAFTLEEVTGALSQLAESVVRHALRQLLLAAMARGEFSPTDADNPETRSGIIVLGMGKLGGCELNYSSDIDLIVLFDKETLPYSGAKNAQHFMNKLASDLVTVLQERTSDGYVFRTDLRLRPDPMSTPLAVNTAAAVAYYETVGQNWERAAMIKARPVAGDIKAGEAFLRELIPYVWRKTLDFATIADIHSIKRQMNVGAGAIALPGHNIKTGIGGIREIEFYAATQQLVWGGRIPELRVRATMDAMDALTEYDLVAPEVRDALRPHYRYLRTLEHRLQMVEDAQTHSLPSDDAQMEATAIFMGFDSKELFERTTIETLSDVHRVYTDSMGDSAPLAVDGNLVFTGVEADPGTLETLARMGYVETQRVSDIIQGWHRGHRRSTRSKRSRQVLTELVPSLLSALGKTANPDSAFFHFDDFIDRIPSGAQIFSLLVSRPELLSLLADILGSAPALGDTLSNDPSLLDAVLEPDFVAQLPTREDLENLLTERLRYAHEYEQKMGYLRLFNNEKRFQAGVHLIKGLATPKHVGTFLSDLAEVILQAAMQEVWAEYGKNLPLEGGGGREATGGGAAMQSHSTVSTPTLPLHLSFTPLQGEGKRIPFVILGLGKLGARAMTFGSDLDIVFLYEDSDAATESRIHLNRLSQRLISALTLLTREGRLFEVDTRLRPGGQDGPLATSLAAFDQYFEKSAWTYEFMALTRARVVAANDPAFAERVADIVKLHVLKARDAEQLRGDVTDMRERIAKEFPTNNPWALKHVRGGMVDVDFIAQYLTLKYGHAHPQMWQRSSRRVFEYAAKQGILDLQTASLLVDAKKFLSDLMSLLRLSAPGGLITDDAPAGLKRLLVDGMRMGDFDSLKSRVVSLEQAVMQAYEHMKANKF